MEAQPTRFFVTEVRRELRKTAGELGQFLGALPDDLVFVPNATTGCNAVLRSLRLEPGDEIVHLDHVYNAVRNTIRYVAERCGARVVVAKLPFPRPDKSQVLEQIKQAITPRTRLAVIDHITSSSALVLPIGDIVRLCRDAGVAVLVDGAHAPGQVPLDLTALGADFYTGNCHKWLMAPKGSAFLHARRDRQRDLHPVTISHGFEQGFCAEFDWTGTSDPTAFLALPAALAFFHRLGGHALAERNKALASEAGALLAARLDSEVGASAEMTAGMALVRLPVRAEAQKVREALLGAAIDAPVHALGDALWLRLSAQAYNDLSDYERLAAMLPKVLDLEM